MLGPSDRLRHRDNAEVLEIGGQANRERGAGVWGRCRGTTELQDSGVVEPARLFQLKCPSHALEAATHLNRNKPLVPRI
jgi:hypothetical protein